MSAGVSWYCALKIPFLSCSRAAIHIWTPLGTRSEEAKVCLAESLKNGCLWGSEAWSATTAFLKENAAIDFRRSGDSSTPRSLKIKSCIAGLACLSSRLLIHPLLHEAHTTAT